jgi:hypothetical protein
MRVINIIVVNPCLTIVSVDSFGIPDEEKAQEVVDKAEVLFKMRFLEYGYDEDDYPSMDYYLEEGSGLMGGCSISIVWSDI